jgi:hypothetical protein
VLYVGRVQATLGPPGVASPSAIPGLATGDLLLVLVSDRDQTAQDVPGYTQLADVAHGDGVLRASVWAKRVTGAPGSEPDVSITWGGGGARVAEVQAWRGGDPSTILDAAVSTATGAGSVTTPGVTTVTAGALALHFVAAAAPFNGTIAGTAPLDVAVAAQLINGPSGSRDRQGAFALTTNPAGATGDADASGGNSATQTIGILIPLRVIPPVEAGRTDSATLGAAQDAVYDPTVRGINTDTITAGATQDAVQAEVGAATAAATLGSIQDAVLAHIAGEAAPSSLGASADAAYVPAGEVLYPSADTWQVTIAGLGSEPTKVEIRDDRGAVIVLYLTDEGIVPQTSEVVGLSAVADANYADRGGLTAATTVADTADGDFQSHRSPGWLARFVRVAWSWVGGPYIRIPAEQVADATVAATIGGAQEGYFTPLHAVADTEAAVAIGSEQEAVFHIVEPKVVIRVPVHVYGLAVKAMPLGTRGTRTPRAAVEAEPHALGVRADGNALNVIAETRRR